MTVRIIVPDNRHAILAAVVSPDPMPLVQEAYCLPCARNGMLSSADACDGAHGICWPCLEDLEHAEREAAKDAVELALTRS